MTITSSTTFLEKAGWVWNKYISSIKIKKASSPVSAEAFGRSCLGFSPLWYRIFIALWAVAIITWSSRVFRGPIYFWPIYMTHWGLLLILSESLFGIAVALAKKRDYFKDDTPRLPWYVKVYWVLYNTSIAVAFLITTFYWSLLYGRSIEIHFVLDLNLHGINSALMALELILAAHPSRLVHCYQPTTFGLVYVLFGVVYFFAGGVDP
ncbi:Protein rolling stone [Eumeta japonica]|uniref:Protein rolling stone n=1 Tax=Eumeta variegata TaxID=151549 RepID=A0A4C1VTW4_EUMVA|nr:Protein rolling stone [Eumeta japonica]